jgi:hypothetical protein
VRSKLDSTVKIILVITRSAHSTRIVRSFVVFVRWMCIYVNTTWTQIYYKKLFSIFYKMFKIDEVIHKLKLLA